MDFAGQPTPTPLFVGSVSPQFAACGELRQIAVAAAASVTWVANLCLYVPFSIPFAYPVRRVWWSNGSTIGANVDVGVFSATGTRLLHAGTTAQVGTSAEQNVAIAETEVLLRPGRYYFALVSSGTTANITGWTSWTANMLRITGCLQEALGSASLPTSMTPAAVTNALFPVCGVTRTPSGF